MGSNAFLGWCTLALAAVTAVMVWFTRRAAETGAKAAKATTKAAVAATKEAKATERLVRATQTDRELTWRPFIQVEPLIETGREPKISGRITAAPIRVTNIGGGPALGLRIFLWPDQEKTEWSRSVAVDLGVGRDATVLAGQFSPMQPVPVYEWFGYGQDSQKRENQGSAVLFWRDVLGWRYRLPAISFPVFDPLKGFTTERVDLRFPDADRAQVGDGAPGWANDIRIFPTAPGW